MNSYNKSNAQIKGLIAAAGLAGLIAGCSRNEDVALQGYSDSDAGANRMNSVVGNAEAVIGRPGNDSYLRDFSDNYDAKADETYVERPLFSKYHLLFNGNKVDVVRNRDFVAGALDVEKGKHRLSTDSSEIAIKTIRFYSWEYNLDSCKDYSPDGSCWHYIKSMDVKNGKFEFKIGDYGIYKLEVDIARDESKEEGKRYFIIDAKPQKTPDNKAGETKVIIEKVKKEKHSLKKALRDDAKNTAMRGKGASQVNMPNHRIRFPYSR